VLRVFALEFSVLLFKIVLAPVMIALVSLAGRKWGAAFSGWLLGIPFSSGPILFFLALEQGPQFAASTAIGSLLGIIGWGAFTVVYARCCFKLPWWWSTLIGWAAYFAVAAAILPLHSGEIASFVLVCVALAVILLGFPHVSPPPERGTYGKYDLVLRMVTASIMVVTLTGFARLLGPMRSGILSAFPAYTTILAVFSHRQHVAAAANTMKGVAIGLYTAATFFLILSPALLRMNLAAAFALATLGALAVQFASLIYVRRRLS